MNRLLILLFTLILSSGIALTAQKATIIGDNHGVAPKQSRRTLAKIVIDDPLPRRARQMTIEYNVPERSARWITGLSFLVSDSLATRDLDDYKGRVQYSTFSANSPLPVSKLPRGRKVIYVTADIGSVDSFTESDTLTLDIKRIFVDETPLEIEYKSPVSRRLHRGYEALFVPGDGGSRNYRIPALLRTDKGTIIAMADRRKFNQTDLPEDIDIIMRRSTDGGRSWSKPEILVEGKGVGKGFGDVALVQTRNGKIIMIFVGGVGLWKSTPTEPQRTYISESTDDGITWTAPRDITHYIYGQECPDLERKEWFASFCASGQGIVTSSGRIMFVAAIRHTDKEWVLHNYALYSDDEGETWQLSDKAYTKGDEAKLSLLPNGDILMSVRNQGRQEDHQRFFAISNDNGRTWQRTHRFLGIHDPGCNGAMLQIRHKGRGMMMLSLPLGPDKRTDGSIYTFDYMSGRWSAPVTINPGMSAYSDMVMIDEDMVGYFVEEDEEMSMVFIRFTLEDLFGRLETIHCR